MGGLFPGSTEHGVSPRQSTHPVFAALLQASTAQNTLEPLRAPADNKAKDEDMEEERE